jgi:VanZ family protein
MAANGRDDHGVGHWSRNRVARLGAGLGPEAHPNPSVAARMRHRSLVTAAAWVFLVFIVFATLSPAYLRPRLPGAEPTLIVLFERFGAYAVLGLLFSISYPRRYGLVFIVVFGSAILLELLQIIIPDRDARVVDAVEKLAGGGLGTFAAHWLIRRVRLRII